MAAKKTTKTSSKKTPVKGKSTAVRHTPIPQVVSSVAAVAKREVTGDMIARRAYEIWTTTGASELENWAAAERELRAA